MLHAPLFGGLHYRLEAFSHEFAFQVTKRLLQNKKHKIMKNLYLKTRTYREIKSITNYWESDTNEDEDEQEAENDLWEHLMDI